MSFDLAVWWEPGPITARQAHETYLLLCDAGGDEARWPQANAAFDAFHRALTEQYPPRSVLGDDVPFEASPWMDDPFPDESYLRQLGGVRDHVILHIDWARADEMRALVRDLAFEHGLVVFEPANTPLVHQANNLQPTPERPVLQMRDGSLLDAPNPDEIAAALGTLDTHNWFAILSTGDQEYVQTAVGGGQGARDSLPVGSYDVELRAGSAEEHYMCSTTDLDVVVRAFQCVAAGEDDWGHDLDWARLVFE